MTTTTETITYETLIYEKSDHLAKITLNRPDQANGMNMQMGKDIYAAAQVCQQDSDIRAILLAANGKMFSAGGDLNDFASYNERLPEALIELTDYLHGAIEIFAGLDAPLVIAVNGAAAGAGFSLAVSGDLVIAGESASFTMAYTALGFSPDGSASYYLPRLIGLRKTQELMINNRKLSASEALDWGLVTQVVSDEELMASAEKLATRLSTGPTKAFGTVKRLLAHTYDHTLPQQLQLEAKGISGLSATDDGKEGLQAFLNKRKPEFNG